MLFISIASAISAFELFNIMQKFGNRPLKLMLGYDVYIEIFFSVVLGIVAGSTGAVSAFVIAMVTGFFITIALHIVKHTYGYAKIKRINGKFKYIEYPGTTLAEFVRNGSIKWFNRVKDFSIALVKPTSNGVVSA